MHETIEAIQVALTVWTTVGVGGYAVGALRGRRGHESKSSRASYAADQSGDGKDAAETVSDNPAEHRFEIRVGGALVGFTEYERGGGEVAFYHTEVDPQFRGRGLAGKLIGFALDASREAGLSVRSSCPFVSRFVEKHTQYQELMAPTAPADSTEATSDAPSD